VETASIVEGLAETLAYLHARGGCHLDVKPANIILTEDRSSVLLLPEPPALKAGIVGTPAYMELEQVEGRRVDGRTDVYNLSVVLYEMLCGQLPFADSVVWERLRRVREEDPRRCGKWSWRSPGTWKRSV
jgi:serine/threonine-protein kinase